MPSASSVSRSPRSGSSGEQVAQVDRRAARAWWRSSACHAARSRSGVAAACAWSTPCIFACRRPRCTSGVAAAAPVGLRGGEDDDAVAAARGCVAATRQARRSKALEQLRVLHLAARRAIAIARCVGGRGGCSSGSRRTSCSQPSCPRLRLGVVGARVNLAGDPKPARPGTCAVGKAKRRGVCSRESLRASTSASGIRLPVRNTSSAAPSGVARDVERSASTLDVEAAAAVT